MRWAPIITRARTTALVAIVVLAGALIVASSMLVPRAGYGEESQGPTVCLQPLGVYHEDLLKVAERGIKYIYGFEVQVLAERKLPEEAWYEKRERWRADTILDVLSDWRADNNEFKDCDMVVGFTRRDISVTKGDVYDWGIFGLGEISGDAAVVSTYRLGRKKKHDDDRAKRTVKVVNHEIGHVLGIPHGGEPGCLMNDAEGTIKTVDAETGLLCEPSIEWIEERFNVTLTRHKEMDWSGVLGTD